ncbi:hypothetical protein Trydic_g23002 [Trypoxylus dichotomus]
MKEKIRCGTKFKGNGNAVLSEKNEYLVNVNNNGNYNKNQHEILEEVFKKADKDNNGKLDSKELAQWIRMKIVEHISSAVSNNFGLFAQIDVDPKNGVVTWKEYHAYFLKKRGFSRIYVQSHDEKRHKGLQRAIKEQIMRDKASWMEAARSDPDSLTVDEFLAFTHPESSATNQLALVDELYDKFDRDGDETLSEDEFAVLQTDGGNEEPIIIRQDENQRRAEFRNVIDLNGDGRADRRELLHYVAPQSPRHSEHEAEALFALADGNQDNMLSLDEILAHPNLFLRSKMSKYIDILNIWKMPKKRLNSQSQQVVPNVLDYFKREREKTLVAPTQVFSIFYQSKEQNPVLSSPEKNRPQPYLKTYHMPKSLKMELLLLFFKMSAQPSPASQTVDREKIYQWILELTNPETRENALLELSKKREVVPDLAPMLWNSFGTIAALLQEIINIYPAINPPTLNAHQSNRVCNALALLQCVASHPETRSQFLLAHVPLFLYPFLHTVSKTRPFEYLRLTSLGVIGALVKTDEQEVITFLLTTEIIPLCLRIMESGSELSKTVATFILQKILLDDSGLSYICQTYDRFSHVAMILGKMVLSLAKEPSARLLKHVVRCYLRLSDNPRAREALRQCLPDQLRDQTFAPCLQEDKSTNHWLSQLLKNLDTPGASDPRQCSLIYCLSILVINNRMVKLLERRHYGITQRCTGNTGYSFNGSPLVVEPSVASGKKRGSMTGLSEAPTVQVGNGWM